MPKTDAQLEAAARKALPTSPAAPLTDEPEPA